MRDLRLEIDSSGVTEQKVKQRNCYHFLSVALLNFNDLIFRKRLLNSSWQFRKKVLTELKNYLVQGKKFQTFETDKDIASLKRDYILLFGSESDITNRLTLETKFLPLNQRPSYHEMYALITELSGLYQDISTSVNFVNFEESAASLRAKELTNAFDFIERNTPQINSSWISCTIQNGKKLGRLFAAPSKEAAEKFFDDVVTALDQEEKGEKFTSQYVGLRALGFLEPDPLLFLPKSIEQEKDLVSQIYRAVKLGESGPASPEDEQIQPNKQDFLDALKEEKEASL